MDKLKIGVDASMLVENKTGVGNYVNELLLQMASKSGYQFYLYSNKKIVFPDFSNIKKIHHKPYRTAIPA